MPHVSLRRVLLLRRLVTEAGDGMARRKSHERLVTVYES